MKTFKKSSALLITLLLITIISALALSLARSLISGINFSLNISDSIVAEEASKAGLEYALLYYRDDPNKTLDTIRINLDTDEIDTTSPLVSRDSWVRYVDVTIKDVDHYKVIETVGYYGNVFRRHTLSQAP